MEIRRNFFDLSTTLELSVYNSAKKGLAKAAHSHFALGSSKSGELWKYVHRETLSIIGEQAEATAAGSAMAASCASRRLLSL